MSGTGDRQRTLIVIPALNEVASIASVIADINSQVPTADVVVVDDGSFDGTSVVAVSAGARVIKLPFNLGVGGAMRAGFAYGRDHGYQAVVQVDADGQHDAAFIPELVAELAEADLVIGSRFANGDRYEVSRSRRFAMRLLALVLSRMNRRHLTDVTSGFRAAGPKAIAVFATELPAEYLGDTVEALVLCRKAGLRVTEVPVVMRQRTTGRPSQGLIASSVHLARAFLVILLAAVRPRPREIVEMESG